VELAQRTASIVEFSVIDMAWLAALRAPSFLQTIVPFVTLFAAMMTLLTLNKRQELVITRASGMSAWQFIAPLCAGSLMIGILTVLIFNPVATLGLAQSEDVQIELGLKAPRGSNIVPWFRQLNEDGALIIGAEQASSGGTFLGRPSLFFFDANDNPVQRVDADTGTLADGYWVLNRARVYKDGGQSEVLEEFRTPASIDVKLLGQALTPPETIAFFSLPASMESAEAFGLPSSPYAMRWHSLIALPALLVAMTLIAATVSLRFARFGHSSSAILGGILAGFLLYVVTAMADALGGAAVIAPILAAWLPVIAASFFGVTFLLHREDG
ncbi:MAG: LptF/LptG family permease, partial [Notoacmeibacter sp.]